MLSKKVSLQLALFISVIPLLCQCNAYRHIEQDYPPTDENSLYIRTIRVDSHGRNVELAITVDGVLMEKGQWLVTVNTGHGPIISLRPKNLSAPQTLKKLLDIERDQLKKIVVTLYISGNKVDQQVITEIQ